MLHNIVMVFAICENESAVGIHVYPPSEPSSLLLPPFSSPLLFVLMKVKAA